MLWTLAESDILGLAPQTWAAIGTLIVAIVGPIIGYFVTKAKTEADAERAEKAAIDAVTDRKQAKGYAEDAAKALEAMTEKLDEANAIAKKATGYAERSAVAGQRRAAVAERQIQLEEAKHQTSYKVDAFFIPKGAEALLRLRITNTSIAKDIQVVDLAIQDGQGVIHRLPFVPWENNNRVRSQETKEIFLPLNLVFAAGANQDAAGERAKLLIRCATDKGLYKWIRSLQALWYLRTAAAIARLHEENTGKPPHLRQSFSMIPCPTELEDSFGNPESVCQ